MASSSNSSEVLDGRLLSFTVQQARMLWPSLPLKPFPSKVRTNNINPISKAEMETPSSVACAKSGTKEPSNVCRSTVNSLSTQVLSFNTFSKQFLWIRFCYIIYIQFLVCTILVEVIDLQYISCIRCCNSKPELYRLRWYTFPYFLSLSRILVLDNNGYAPVSKKGVPGERSAFWRV